MRRIVLVMVGAISIGLAGPALAQDASATGSSDKHLELARELLEESGGVAAA